MALLPGVPGAATAEEDPLESLLPRLAATAVQYREVALRFSCEERITWSSRGKGGSAAFGYVFVFEEGGGFNDYRTPPRKGSRKKPLPKVEPEAFGVPAYLGSAYLWIFSFKAERQSRNRYEVIGNEDVAGRPALKIHFEPIPPMVAGLNDWFGTAWVDPQTAQIVKVEAFTPANWARLKKVEHVDPATDPGPETHVLERITTWFTIETKGMRFPERVQFRRELYEPARKGGVWSMNRTDLLEVNQVYRDYEFFGVDTVVHQP